MRFEWKPEYGELATIFLKQHFGESQRLTWCFPCMRDEYPWSEHRPPVIDSRIPAKNNTEYHGLEKHASQYHATTQYEFAYHHWLLAAYWRRADMKANHFKDEAHLKAMRYAIKQALYNKELHLWQQSLAGKPPEPEDFDLSACDLEKKEIKAWSELENFSAKSQKPKLGDPMLTALRHKLMEITENVPLLEHPAHIESLRAETNHSIVVVESKHPIERYTCAVHAFNLIEDATYVEVAGFGLGRTFAGAEFINFLLEHQLLTPCDISSVLPDNLVLYFDNGVFRHVGRMKAHHRVLSKWGTGYLYGHQVWEVPSNYGEEVRYFIGPNEGSYIDLFIQYAESKGFSFE